MANLLPNTPKLCIYTEKLGTGPHHRFHGCSGPAVATCSCCRPFCCRPVSEVRTPTSPVLPWQRSSRLHPTVFFIDGAKRYRDPVVKFLARNGSPLLANVYPYFAHKGDPNKVPLPYALFEKPAGYRSLFDAQVNAIYAALEKSGGGGVRIVVSESGWPSQGGASATVQNAATYYRNLIKHVKGGTVKKATPIETYLFAKFDENQKGGDETERHFGLFSPDKRPKYQISIN